MSRFSWQQIRRTALVLVCAAYFTTLTVIGQVAEGDRVPEPTGPRVGASR